MFNYLFHPYLRWLRGRSESSGPDFGLDRYGLLPQLLARHIPNFAAPEAEALLPSAPSPDLTNFLVEPPNDMPGFRVEQRNDDVPGFSLNEKDVPPPESPSPAGIDTAAPDPSDTAETSTVPPGVEAPDPTPQIPDWLNNVLTMPVPRLSTAFDPKTGRRIVPYEPLINWTRPYPTVHQDAHGTDSVGASGTEMGGMPGPPSLEALAARQWAPPALPERPADTSTHPDRPTMRETRWNSWSQPPDARPNGANSEDKWWAVVPPRQQQTQVSQEQRLSNVPVTTFSRNPVSIRPAPLNEVSPIEFSVYNPDIDPGYDELFDLVQGVQENKAQGDDAKRKEQTRIEKASPKKGMAGEIRVYADGVPGYMVADILHRPNGTTVVMITEVKSGDGKLTPHQATKLAAGVRTGKFYIVNEPAAKALDIEPRKTFAEQRIIPQVYIVGGDQDAIKKQLRNLGVEAIPEKARRGPPRLRIILPPT